MIPEPVEPETVANEPAPVSFALPADCQVTDDGLVIEHAGSAIYIGHG